MGGETKIDRLLRLILLLQQDEAGNATDLAQRFGVDRRTIHRYFHTLQRLNVPCFFDDEAKRYRIGKEFFLPPTHLTAAESLALIALVEQVAGREQIPLTKPAQYAVEKIRGRLNDQALAELDQAARRIDIRLAASSDTQDGQIDDVHDRINHAITNGRKLRCRYDSKTTESNGSAWFVFQPYRLWFEKRAWYVVGHHQTHGQLRCLKLLRFTGVQPTDQRYATPNDFSIDQYRGNAWRMIRGDQRHDVAIHFDPEVAETVADTKWHHTQSIDHHPDASITFHCQVDGLSEIKHWLLAYGLHAKALHPPQLANEIATMAKATAERYA